MKVFTLLLFTAVLCCCATPSHSQKNKITRKENVVYGMVGGMGLLMDVYQPEKSNQRGIIYICGSGFGYGYEEIYNQPTLKEDCLYDTSFSAKWAQDLGQRGYTVFVINHRFSPASRYPDPLYDCQRAVRFIRYNAKQFGIDPAHIGAMGHSSGAYFSSMIGLLDTMISKPRNPIDSVSSKVQAVISMAAPFDLSDIDRIADTAMAREFVLTAILNYIGTLPPIGNEGFKLAGTYAKASPYANITNTSSPILIYYSDNDPVIPPRQAPAMYKRLLENKVAAKLVERHNQEHNPKPDMQEVDNWFKLYLK